jgi:hypothetical protein
MLLSGPAPSGAALARQVGIKQPSIVRILRHLEGRDLVMRAGRSVVLTEAGRSEARRIERERSVDMSKSVLRLAVQERARLSEALSALAGTQNVFGSGIAKAMEGYNTFARDALFSPVVFEAIEQYNAMAKEALRSPVMTDAVPLLSRDVLLSPSRAIADVMAGIDAKLTVGSAFADVMAGIDAKLTVGSAFADAIANMPSVKFPHLVADVERLTAGVTRGMASALVAQELAVSALADTALRGSLYADVFADTTPVLSRMIADLGAVTRVEGVGSARRIMSATDRLVESHGTLFAASLDWLGPLGQPSEAARQMAWSTLAAASGVSAARKVVTREDHDPIESAVDKALEAVASALYSELDAIDPLLATMLNGALEARERGGPDWHRHMAQSLRTLMMAVLDLRAPRTSVKRRLGSDDQRHRLRYLMGGRTAAAFAEGTMGMFTVTWNTLSAEAKTAKQPRFTQAGAIQLIAMYCHLLRLMLGAPTLESEDDPD